MNNFFAVILGGATGASLRYISIVCFARLSVFGMNIATLIINAIGCFFAGLLFAYTENNQINSVYRLFFITGMIGAYTTLAAFGLESIYYLKNGNWIYFSLNIILTNLISLFMIWLGFRTAGLFH